VFIGIITKKISRNPLPLDDVDFTIKITGLKDHSFIIIHLRKE